MCGDMQSVGKCIEGEAINSIVLGDTLQMRFKLDLKDRQEREK